MFYSLKITFFWLTSSKKNKESEKNVHSRNRTLDLWFKLPTLAIELPRRTTSQRNSLRKSYWRKNLPCNVRKIRVSCNVKTINGQRDIIKWCILRYTFCLRNIHLRSIRYVISIILWSSSHLCYSMFIYMFIISFKPI